MPSGTVGCGTTFRHTVSDGNRHRCDGSRHRCNGRRHWCDGSRVAGTVAQPLSSVDRALVNFLSVTRRICENDPCSGRDSCGVVGLVRRGGDRAGGDGRSDEPGGRQGPHHHDPAVGHGAQRGVPAGPQPVDPGVVPLRPGDVQRGRSGCRGVRRYLGIGLPDWLSVVAERGAELQLHHPQYLPR